MKGSSMLRCVALGLALLLAGCGADFGSRPGRTPGLLNTERPEAMPSNAAPMPPGSLPR